MRKVVARRSALTCTSKSMGKETPKRSASVNISLARPAHCLVILPTLLSPSGEVTRNSTSPQTDQVQQGPLTLSTHSPAAFLMLKAALKSDQSCSMLPRRLPLMLYTSIRYYFQKKYTKYKKVLEKVYINLMQSYKISRQDKIRPG